MAGVLCFKKLSCEAIVKFGSKYIIDPISLKHCFEPLPLAKRDETLPCALFLFIGKCMEMIV